MNPVRFAIVVALGVVAAVASEVAHAGGTATALIVLTGAIAVGELLELRPRHRGPIPLSYAAALVVIRAYAIGPAMVSLVIAHLVALAVRRGSVRERLEASAVHLGAALAGLGVFHLLEPLDLLAATPWMLAVLAASAIAMLAVHEAVGFAETRRTPPIGGADLSLIASGMLMAIGFRAVGGHQSVGLWGVALFAVPLLAAWYSFERLSVISRTSEQTIQALSVVPEVAGLARRGHAARVAELSVRLGDEVGLRPAVLDDLRAAALLHHLGHLCLDAPEVRTVPVGPSEVADKGAEILRQTDLAAAGDLMAGDSASTGAQILRLASAYDDLVADRSVDDALDALAAGPGFLTDRRILDVLARVVTDPDERSVSASATTA